MKRYRSGQWLKPSSVGSTYLVPATSYKVTAYRSGGVVSAGGTTCTLREGHGFITGDWFIVNPTAGTSAPAMYEATLVSGNDLTSAYNASIGDVLFNLMADGGGVTPQYNDGYTLYSDSAGAVALTDNTATTDTSGNYGYYHNFGWSTADRDSESQAWELVRDSGGTIQGYVRDAWQSQLRTPATTVDNAIVRWHGTDGRAVQAYSSNTPTIDDSGVLSVNAATITTLTAPTSTANTALTAIGTVTLGTTSTTALTVSGALTHTGKLDHGAVTAFAAGDTTPDVSGGTIFKTANTGSTVITMFDGGVTGQRIVVLVQDANTDFTFVGTNLKGNVGANWTTATTNDWLEAIYDGTNWYCSVHDCTA